MPLGSLPGATPFAWSSVGFLAHQCGIFEEGDGRLSPRRDTFWSAGQFFDSRNWHVDTHSAAPPRDRCRGEQGTSAYFPPSRATPVGIAPGRKGSWVRIERPSGSGYHPIRRRTPQHPTSAAATASAAVVGSGITVPPPVARPPKICTGSIVE